MLFSHSLSAGDLSIACRGVKCTSETRPPPDIAQVETFYRQALALAEELGMRPLQAHSHCSLGILCTKIGWREQAREELSTAIALYRAMEMQFWLSQAEAALVQVT
jgi:predicted RNA polymerase sigma factor